MSNNAFRSSVKKEENKGFLETHGLALGGGVLALGMMMVGSQYLSQDDLSADLTDEAVVAETTEIPAEAVEAPATEESVVAETVEELESAETLEGSEEVILAENEELETSEESETVTDELAETDSTENTTSEPASAISDEEPVTATETVVITNPVTANVAPLYADPVEGEATESVVAEQTEEEIVRAPAALLSFIPAAPAVPAAIVNVPVQQEGELESQEAVNLNPVIPQ